MINKSNMPKVSIIIPVYNVESFLPACIESIQNQNYPNMEVLFIDDGSTDKSGIILDKYAKDDERIKIIHKSNTGVSDTRNIGLSKASGEYICFADSDDILMYDYIDYLVKLIKKYDADISLTTEMFGNFQKEQVSDEEKVLYTAEDALEGILTYNIPIGVYCKLFKRKFLIENNIRFNKELFIGEGFNFNADAFQNAKKIAVGNRRIYFYRRDNPTSATTSFSEKKVRNGLKAIDILEKNLIIKTGRISNALKFARWRTNSDAYDVIKLAHAENKNRSLYKECLAFVKRDALVAFKVPTSRKNKERALIMKFVPALIPKAMLYRRRKYNAEV